MSVREHDVVVLTESLPEADLEAGDLGTVVHVHSGGAAFEVELMTLTGGTVAVVTLGPDKLRPVRPRDVAHVRELAAS